MVQLMGLPKKSKLVRYKWIFKITKKGTFMGLKRLWYTLQSCLKTPRVVGCKIFKRVEGIMRVEEVILNVVGLPSVVGDKDKYQCG